MITNAGARYTNELPCTNGSLVPKKECSIVVRPDTKSIVEITIAVSSCEHIEKMLNKSSCLPCLFKLRELTSVPPIAGTIMMGMNTSEPAKHK